MHGEFAINMKSKTVDKCHKWNPVRRQFEVFNSFLPQLLSCAQPDELRLVTVHLQTISRHPTVNVLYTTCEPLASELDFSSRRRQADFAYHLHIRICTKAMRVDQLKKTGSFEDEKRAQST